MMHNKHEIIKKNLWKFQIWDGMYDLKTIDKLISESESEVKENEKPQELLFEKTKLNIITDVGLVESLKRDLGTSSSSNAYMAIGTGNNPESPDQTNLISEVSRKPVGTRSIVGLQGQYRTAWSTADFASDSAEIWEAGLFTELAGGVMVARVVSDVMMSLTSTQTLTTTIYSDVARSATF